MKPLWREGNEVELLINGEAFFPAVFAGIRHAKRQVLLETFIIFDDDVGRELKSALLEAAGNGAHVEIMVDGYGSAEINDDYVAALTKAGITVHMFDPRPRLLGYRTNLFRRLHRKIVVIDGHEAYVGGINFCCDHLAAYGPKTKQDYAVRVRGPIVADIHQSSSELFQQAPGSEIAKKALPAGQHDLKGSASIQLAIRDNDKHSNDIEQGYLTAIRSASDRIMVANAYFYPGYRLLRELRRAARRGVKVTLILQGEPDMPWVRVAAQLLYGYLIKDGIQIFEYCRRPLHGKVALVDETWSTVGSSNLDPLSLSLNLEANLIIRDADFNEELFTHLEELVASECQRITREKALHGYWWRAPISYLGYHFTRHFPALAGFLPAHTPHLEPVLPDTAEPKPNLTTLKPDNQNTVKESKPTKRHAQAKLWARRLLTLLFSILIPVLFYQQIKDMDWDELVNALRGYPATTLMLCALVAAASYITYASFDLLGRIYTRHRVPISRVLTITAICYAFTLSLTAFVGGIALRYRLYSRQGLSTATTTRILSLSLVTNWGGYLLLAGTIFSFGLLNLPQNWKIGDTGLQILGAVMLLAGLAYLAACAFSTRRSWHVRDHEIELPPLRLALMQMGAGALNWMLMGLLIYLLLPEEAFYPAVLGILLIASVAGVITHIPGNLGLLEAVFLTLLGNQFSNSEILAALIGYRAIYFLIPLAIATLGYFVLEHRAAGENEQSTGVPSST